MWRLILTDTAGLRASLPWNAEDEAAYIARIRNISRSVAQSYYDSRERLGFPMLAKSAE